VPALKSDASTRSPAPALALPGELLELATDFVVSVDEDWRITYLNRRARGKGPADRERLGKSMWDEFPDLIGTAVELHYREAMQSRRPNCFEVYYEPSAVWYEINVSPLSSGGLALWFRNIDSRKEAQEELRRAEERYRLAASAATDLLVEWNLETGEVVWREALLSGAGFGDGENKTPEWCASRVHPDDRERVSAEIRKSIETGERFETECRIQKSDDSYADIQQTGVVQRDAAGKPLRMIFAARDVTDRNRANEDLRQREAQLANIFSQALVGIAEAHADGRTRLINGRFCEILGRSEEEILGVDIIEFTHPDDVPWNQEIYQAKRSAGEPFQIEKRYVRPDGSIVWCKVSISFVLAPTDEVERSIVIAEDITEQRQAAERLKWASEHDSLTGLPNRRAFEARLQAATIRAMHSGGEVGLLLLDLDHFKHVNDSFGHGAGDYLLREIGERLEQCVRAGDLVARLGGDEFAIIIERHGGGLDLLQLGGAILDRLRRTIRFEGRTMRVGASIGGAVFPADAVNAHELLKNADIALYALKDSGRGDTSLFHDRMRDQALVVASQLTRARSALSERSVDPHYQPKVDLRTGKIVGFEALLRWHDIHQGLQLPSTVAEAFRDHELASKIGELVQRRVFGDLRGWMRRNVPVEGIAINAAPAEFLRDDFAERLLARLNEYGILPSLIEVEVTEHVFLDRGSSFVGRALSVLSESGVKIALDDFGTGYSSLSHLRDFPVDVVKIDKSFVDKIVSDSEVRAIVSAVVALARSLRIAVVAEGVETEQQRLVLLEEGCVLGQGYHFGHPIAADHVPDLVKASLNTGRAAA
jgi:diguanylate cyclase (GGDEF)-like protein/PAS domain S-box-containing protein